MSTNEIEEMELTGLLMVLTTAAPVESPRSRPPMDAMTMVIVFRMVGFMTIIPRMVWFIPLPILTIVQPADWLLQEVLASNGFLLQ